MKITKHILAACILVGMAACDTDKEMAVFNEDSGAIKIDAVISSVYTRSNPVGTNEQQIQFNNGDKIRLSCEDSEVTYMLSGGQWIPTDNYYLRWGSAPITYSAFYPEIDGANVNNFSLPANQQSLESLANADYMTCTIENAMNDGSGVLQLNLNRRMAKVVMTLDDIDAQSKALGIRIGSYQGYTDGNVSLGTALISPYVTIPEGGKAGQNGCKYTAIVAPGVANPNSTFVYLNYKGEDLVLPGIPTLKAGFCYDFTLKVEGAVIKLSDPVVTPWETGTITGGDVTELQLDAYYVKEHATGNATGMDWDNAMGVDGLRNLLRTNSNSEITAANAKKMDGKNIYVAGGTYLIADQEAGLKLEYSGYGKQVEIMVLGGYDPQSTQKDLSKRDMTRYLTTFTGDANNNGIADTGDYSLFTLGNQIDITFEGCTFSCGYHSNKKIEGYNGGFLIANGGSGKATLQLNHCIIEKCYNAGVNGSGDAGGSAIFMYMGTAKLNHVQLKNNKATSRGGAIRANDSGSVLFMNNCSITGNEGGQFGYAIQMSNGHLCMNNTTVTNNSGQDGAINGAGSMLIVNSTIIEDGNQNSGAVIRCESWPARQSFLMNNIILNKKTINPVIEMSGDDTRRLTSKGYNLMGGTITPASTNKFTTSEFDKYNSTIGSLNVVWDTDRFVYTWSGEVDEFTRTTAGGIENAIMTGFKPDSCPYQNLGEEFGKWLEGINALSIDQLGNSRDKNAMWPGSYQDN